TDYFAQTGRYYLVMDYVEGHDLDAWVRNRGPIPPEQAVAWMAQVLDALDYLHSQQPPVIHRDVKPANVKITPAGQAYLVDFGIAKEYHPGRHTITGARALTPGFAPVEQYAARGETDARTDLYGVGATLYYLLTGVEPPDALDRVVGARLPAMSSQDPRLRGLSHLDTVLSKALSLQKEDRWTSAGEMRRALQRPAPGTAAQARSKAPKPATRPDPARSRPTKPLSSGIVLWAMGGAAAGLLVLVLVLLVTAGGDRAPDANASPTMRIVEASPKTATLIPRVTPAAGVTVVQPSPIVSPSATPTAPQDIRTPAPATTATAANTPTIPPTSTTAPSATRPKPTATRRQSTATQPPATGYVAPTLREPFEGDSLQGVVTFVWQWSQGALAADDYFDLRFWSLSELDARTAGRGAAPPTKDTRLAVNLDILHTIVEHGPNTAYYWAVVVVRQPSGAGSAQIVGEWSEKRRFYYSPPDSGPGPEPRDTPGNPTPSGPMPTETPKPVIP
ncbi:MAG: serine/threonine protein kinase, partial [Anaerolineae bacterium]|nr:serine/threonine protein kinase [Anaerolineae bacterium]